MDVGAYGSGRLTWTFEEDKVLGIIEVNVMGVEVEMRTEAEFAMSSTGTIYGIVTHAELSRLKIGGGALGLLGEMSEYVKLVKLAEPLLVEMMTDLPFSYQFRVSGNKLTILNYRTLLAGPNPLGKLGGVVGGADSGLAVLSYFQAIGIVMEGTYTADEGENHDRSKSKPIIRKSTGPNPRDTPREPLRTRRRLAAGTRAGRGITPGPRRCVRPSRPRSRPPHPTGAGGAGVGAAGTGFLGPRGGVSPAVPRASFSASCSVLRPLCSSV